MVFNVSNIKIENLHDQCIESFLQMCIKFDFMAAVEVIYIVWLRNTKILHEESKKQFRCGILVQRQQKQTFLLFCSLYLYM